MATKIVPHNRIRNKVGTGGKLLLILLSLSFVCVVGILLVVVRIQNVNIELSDEPVVYIYDETVIKSPERKKSSFDKALLETLRKDKNKNGANGFYDTINIDPRPPDSNVPPVTYPIVVVGMPKGGTSSITHFFRRIGKGTSHQFCGRRTFRKGMVECGALMKENVDAGLPLFHNAGEYEVYAQLDVERVKGDLHNWQGVCYFPQIEALEKMHEQYPEATLVLNKRSVSAWIESVVHHMGMARRLSYCNITGFPPVHEKYLTTDMLRDFYIAQVVRVREFVAKYPSHRLVEVQIDGDNAGQKMVEAFGGELSCWKVKNTKQDVKKMALRSAATREIRKKERKKKLENN